MTSENDAKQPLNILEIMGYRRSHYHESIDSTSASDITIPMVNANQQYDPPTITRTTKQFAENIDNLVEYIQDNIDSLKSTNLSQYITTDLEDAEGSDKIFAAPPCVMTSKRVLDLKRCRDLEADQMPPMVNTFFMEDFDNTNKILIGFTCDSTIVRYDLNENETEDLNMHPTCQTLYTAESGIEFKRAEYADLNRQYIYVITNSDIRIFKTVELRNLKKGENSISYCNIVDFKKSFSDDKKRYNDNLVIGDIHRRRKIIDLINDRKFNTFVEKYYKLGDFPIDVLTPASYSEDPVIIADVGLVIGKYGVYQIHCYSRKPKNVNEFEKDENEHYLDANGKPIKTGSLHIRCLDNKPVKDGFFYINNGQRYFVAVNGWPKSDSDYVNEDDKYKGFTVFKINDSASASNSYDVTHLFIPDSKIWIAKRDSETNQNLAGAQLCIKNSAGTVIGNWTSKSGGPDVITGLEPGVYTIVETKAPADYIKSENIIFSLSDDGIVTCDNLESEGSNKIIIYNEPDIKTSKLTIKKEDSSTHALLAGASLKIVQGSTELHAWTSGTSAKEIDLEPGTYTLIEVTAPTGYDRASNIQFTVNEDGTVKIGSDTTNGTIIMYNSKTPVVDRVTPKRIRYFEKPNYDNAGTTYFYSVYDDEVTPGTPGYIGRLNEGWVDKGLLNAYAWPKHVQGSHAVYRYWTPRSEWQYSENPPSGANWPDAYGYNLNDRRFNDWLGRLGKFVNYGIAFYVSDTNTGNKLEIKCGIKNSYKYGINPPSDMKDNQGRIFKSDKSIYVWTPKSNDIRDEVRSRSTTNINKFNANKKKVPADGYLKADNGTYININQMLDSHGINGAYVNTLEYAKWTYNGIPTLSGIDVDGFVIKFNGYDQTQKKTIEKYWFVEATNRALCNIVKVYDRHEFNCFSEYKINAAMYSHKDETLVVDVKEIGIIEGIKSYDADNNCGFRFRMIKRYGEYEPINDLYVMNRCFVGASDKQIHFMVSGGEAKTLVLGKDIKTSLKLIEYSSTYDSSNIFMIGENLYNKDDVPTNSRIALIELKYKLDTKPYIDAITSNIGDLISADFLSKDNAISNLLNHHIETMHNEDSLATKLNNIMKIVSGRSVKQSTSFSDNLKMSYIILNYPNCGNDFTYTETDENSTDIYGRINSKTLNVIPTMVTTMKRNSNAIAYYDTVTDETGKEVLNTNKLVYSTCRLSDHMTRLSINVPSTGTYYVDNILGWSSGSRTGSALSRKNLDDGYIQGELEKCTTHYQLILNRVFFNIKNILNVTAQYASAPLKIYSNKNEYDVRHYGMYDSPVIAPLNMNTLNKNFIYDMSSCTNDEMVLSFTLFGGDAMQINILIENYTD